MAKLGISTGIVPDDGTGDSLLDGAVKINSNFDDIYTYFGDGTNLTFTGGGVSSQWVTTGVGIHTLSNVGIGTTNPRFTLEVGAVGASGTSLYVNGDARVTGILTVGSTSITLNGTTNTINVGSGVTINGSTGIIEASSVVIEGTTFTGAAVTSITAGSGISVDQSTGNVTISATGGGGGESYWVETSAGIHTLSNVGIGTTNPTSALTVKGNTSLETLNVSGVSTFAGITTVTGSTLFSKQLNVSGVSTFAGTSKFNGTIDVNVGSATGILFDTGSYTGSDEPIKLWIGNSGGARYFTLTRSNGGQVTFNNAHPTGQNDHRAPSHSFTQTGGDYYALFYNGSVKLYHPASASGILDQKFETIGAGVTVTGTTFTNQLSVSGVSTFNNNITVAGI
jgi:hypothetical protein